MADQPRLIPEACGESALLLHLDQRVAVAVNEHARRLCRVLANAKLPGVEDIVPAYASVLVRFDPEAWDGADEALPYQRLWRAIRPLWGRALALPEDAADGALHRLPVCYGGAAGADLVWVATHCRMPPGEVIARHVAPEYRVAMLGFAPGFAYLLGLDPLLQTPRRDNPRTRVPAGSIGIGGVQTGIYPSALPGGWQLLGRTPSALFNPEREARPSLLQAGDRVRLEVIDEAQFAVRRGAGH